MSSVTENPQAQGLPPNFLLSEDEAATACGVSRPIFRKWVKLGLVQPVDLPANVRRNLYRARDIAQFVETLHVGKSA